MFKIVISCFVCFVCLEACGPVDSTDDTPTCEEDCKDIATPQYPYSKCVAECLPNNDPGK